MIEIFSSGNTVCLNIRHGLSGCKNSFVQLQKDFCNDTEAAACAKILRELFSQSVQEAMKSEYDLGFRDGKRKAKKKDWFKSWISPKEDT